MKHAILTGFIFLILISVMATSALAQTETSIPSLWSSIIKKILNQLDELEKQIKRLQYQVDHIQLIPGPQGPAGPAGTDGNTGPQGSTGPAGMDGNQGPIGPQGPQGIQGVQGIQGPQGLIGPQGPAGSGGTFVVTARDGNTIVLSGGGSIGDATAFCETSETLISGGYRTTGGGIEIIQSKYVLIGRPAWLITAYYPSGSIPRNVTATANCLRVFP